MITCLKTMLDSPRCSLQFFGIVAALALAAAFIAQYVYGLAPCALCVYQRWPYAIVIAIAVAAHFVLQKSPQAGSWLLIATALAFFANAVIAFYHTGVERKWWPSFLEGCAVPEMEGNIADVLARIQTAPVVRCDEIPWTDPVLGWSMANYNVLLCLALGIAALISLRKNAS